MHAVGRVYALADHYTPNGSTEKHISAEAKGREGDCQEVNNEAEICRFQNFKSNLLCDCFSRKGMHCSVT